MEVVVGRRALFWVKSLAGMTMVGGVIGVISACASSPAAETPEPAPAPSAEPPSEEPPPAESPSEEPPKEPSPEGPPAAEGPSPTELVATICEETCQKVQGACNERAASFCRASCGDYVSGAETCPVEVHAALSCQKSADDFLLCSNIAAESCANLYRTMKKCRDGEVEPKPWGVASNAPAESDVPPGFVKKSVSAHGFSQLMPEAAKLETKEGGAFEMTHEDASGITYVTKSLELNQTSKPTSASILRTTTKYVGNDCQPKLRLHGRFETAGVIHVRFDTVCSSGTTYHGIVHFWDGKAVVATTIVKSESVQNPNLEAFLFGFERAGGAPAE